jgi:hypothetical protein
MIIYIFKYFLKMFLVILDFYLFLKSQRFSYFEGRQDDAILSTTLKIH